MEFSSTELFVEILIAGTLFAIGLSPVLVPLVRDVIPRTHGGAAAREHGVDGELPKEWKDLQPWLIAVITIAVIYSLGVAGNRFFELVYTQLHISAEGVLGSPCAAETQKQSANDTCLKIERNIRHQDELYRDWAERHKSYRKILRAGSASSAMFVLLMVAYYLFHKRRHLFAHGGRYCLIAIALFVFFTGTFLAEDWHYKRDLAQYCSDLKCLEAKAPRTAHD